MSTIKAEGIKLDDLIDIKVSGGFYSRLHQLVQGMASTMTPEDFQKEIKKITDEKATEPFAYHLETILSLIAEIERSAKAQGKISVQEVDIEPKGSI